MDDIQVLTWSQLVRIEPGLGQLHLDCRFADHHNPEGFDAEQAWNGSGDVPGLKHRLEQLVGDKAESQDPRVKSRQAYDIANQECFQTLPPNRPGTVRLEPRENQATKPGWSV